MSKNRLTYETLDHFTTFNDELFVLDYKTVGKVGLSEWEPDNQMALYSLASKVAECPLKRRKL